MDITKLKLLKQKNGNGLEMSYEKPGANGDKIAVTGETHTAIIHADLYGAVQAIAPHLALMAFHVRDVEDIAMPDPEQFKNFTVGSYSIIGADEKRGIIISGTLRKDGRAHNFNTPFYRFEEPGSTRYTYMDDLVARLTYIETETTQYLDGSKRGEAAQGSLDLKDPANADAEKMKDVAKMKNGKAGAKKTGTKMQIAKPEGEE